MTERENQDAAIRQALQADDDNGTPYKAESARKGHGEQGWDVV